MHVICYRTYQGLVFVIEAIRKRSRVRWQHALDHVQRFRQRRCPIAADTHAISSLALQLFFHQYLQICSEALVALAGSVDQT